MQVPQGDTYHILFTTRAFATGIPGTLSASTVAVYEEATATPIQTAVAVTEDYNSITGLNHVPIVATSGNGYDVGSYYSVVIEAGTVDSVSVVGEVVGHFRCMPPEDAGAGIPDVNVTHVSDAAEDIATETKQNTAQTDLDTITGSDGATLATAQGLYAPAKAGDSMALSAGAVTNASLAGNMEIVFETDFATNYNTTRNAWATNTQDTVGTGSFDTVTGHATEAKQDTAQADLDAITDSDGVILGAAGVDLIWDEVLTGATHNVTNSAGKRLRQIDAAFEVHSGTAQAGSTSTTIILDTGADGTNNDIYRGDRCVIVAGTGIGEHGIIISYVASTRVATMSEAWVVTPDNTSEFILVPADVDIETWNHTTVTGDGDWAALKAETALIVADTNLSQLRTQF